MSADMEESLDPRRLRRVADEFREAAEYFGRNLYHARTGNDRAGDWEKITPDERELWIAAAMIALEES